jgi:hypothetical protein
MREFSGRVAGIAAQESMPSRKAKPNQSTNKAKKRVLLESLAESKTVSSRRFDERFDPMSGRLNPLAA